MRQNKNPLLSDEDAIRFEREEREEEVTILDRTVLKRPISDLNPNVPVSLDHDAPVSSALEAMRRDNIGCVLVTRQGLLAGVFTERDYVTKLSWKGSDLSATPLSQVMTPDPRTLMLEDRFVFAINRMSVGGFRHIPLVDAAGRPVGIISVKDVLRFLVGYIPEEIMNISPDAVHRFPAKAEGG